MRVPTSFLLCKTLLALAAVLLLAGDAAAYTVPGPEFFGQFLSLIAWMVVAFSSVLLYPVYALVRRLRGRVAKPTTSAADPVAAHGQG